jgi:hypothetical protein
MRLSTVRSTASPYIVWSTEQEEFDPELLEVSPTLLRRLAYKTEWACDHDPHRARLVVAANPRRLWIGACYLIRSP